jgi:uncharacterized SAM-binding protein YcdF (DUF218 family)
MFLIVEDPLEPAAAIVVLRGQVPFREMEAAALYHAAWAPKLVLVKNAEWEAGQALRALGVPFPAEWELGRAALLRLGVPPSAIVVLESEAPGTLEELQIVAQALASEAEHRPLILVTSKFHGRRVRRMWHHVAGPRDRGIVRVARDDPFDPTAWWRERRWILAVLREYLGLLHERLGSPVPAHAKPSSSHAGRERMGCRVAGALRASRC